MRKVFRRFLNRKFDDLSSASSDSIISILMLSCSGCRIMHERQILFLCPILIEGLITNQISLFLPVRRGTEFGKIFGIDCRRFLSPPPPPHLFPTSPLFFAHPRRGPSLARFFARLFDLRLEKERKRLLRRLPTFPLNFNVCRYSIYLMFKVFSREIGLSPRKLFTAPSLNFWTNCVCAVFN